MKSLYNVFIIILIASIAASSLEAIDPSEFEFEGSTQLLVMGRDYGGDVKGDSTSVSMTLEARARLSDAISIDGQFLHVQNLDESGRPDAAYWLSNDTTTVLNELYFDWDLSRSGAGDTRIQLGRQIPAYEFFGSYKIRHKEQSLEGVVLKTKAAKELSLDFGHIERFSTWACREGGPSTVTSEFMDLSERLGFGGGDNGVQFVSAKLSQDESFDLTAYDYFANDFYNNAGLKAVWTFADTNSGSSWAVSGHYIQQDGESGGNMAEHDARSLEMNLSYKQGDLTLDAGWTRIEDGSSLAAPFRTSYLIDPSLLWYTNQYESGTDSVHLKSVYKRDAWTFVALLIEASHEDDRKEREYDVVVKYAFENNVWIAFKGGYGQRSFEGNLPDEDATDLRLFIGHSF